MNDLLLCFHRNKINIPENALYNIYLCSRPTLNETCKKQISYNANAKMSMSFLNGLYSKWKSDATAVNWNQYVKCVPCEERIRLFSEISMCQCCKRHFGKQTKQRIELVGEPIIKGEKLDFVEIYSLNPQFKRYGSICTCNCRHMSRILQKSLLEQIW